MAGRSYRPLYSGCEASSLWRKVGRKAVLAPVLVLSLGLGGCSIGSLDALWGSEKSDITGSITSSPVAKQVSELPPDADLIYARAAASEVLARGDKDASASWENPRSGARGTVTPIASAYNQDGKTCQDFLASYVNGAAQSWLQGAACKPQKGAWQVHSLKPWKRS